MNKHAIILAIAAVLLFCAACQKYISKPATSASRSIQFVLYTNQNFSTDNNIIDFSLQIKRGNQVLLDSALASMMIKDIPGPANKIVFTKTVPDDGTVITAGFLYTIRNVGMSWYLDTLNANTKTKVIEYPFQ